MRQAFYFVISLLLASAALAAEPLYDPKPGHPWDQARDIFYIRQFPTGETFAHPHAFAPPWTEFVPFVQDGAFYERVLARLAAVEKLPPADMEQQPRARRLIFFRDLWPVFDGLQQAWTTVPRDEEATTKAIARRDELLRRLAQLMRRLELTDDEVRALPDAFQIVGEKQLFPAAFDPAAPDKPFFPADLLDAEGPWLAHSREREPSAGGRLHMEFDRYRSLFTAHLRAPDGRTAGLKYLRDFSEAGQTKITPEGTTLPHALKFLLKSAELKTKQVVPNGTTLALLRRALVPTRSGKLLASPFVESLQLIVVSYPEDRRFKFTLDRAEFLAGRFALRILGPTDPVDTSSFESLILPHKMARQRTATEPPNESLIARTFKTLPEISSSLKSCMNCHNHSVQYRLFTALGPSALKGAFLQPDPDQSAASVIDKKETSDAWKLYTRLRMSPRESQP